MSELLVITDIFIIATGTSNRHVRTLAEEAELQLKALDRRPFRREGVDEGKWLLLDFGDLVIHIFDEETRSYYELERLWGNAPRITFEPAPSSA